MSSADILSQEAEGNGVKDAKKSSKKNEIKEFETKMVGDDAKWLFDICEYEGPSNQAVKTHWTKKHRREVQDHEDKKRGEIIQPGNDEKRAKKDEHSDDDDDEDLYEGFDEDDLMRIEAVEDKENKNNETATENMETAEGITITEETVIMLNHELETKKAEIESLKEAMVIRLDMYTLAQVEVEGLETGKAEQEKEIKMCQNIIKGLRNLAKAGAKIQNKTGNKTEETKL